VAYSEVIVGERRINVRKLLTQMNLFDEEYYQTMHPDIREANVDAFDHFYTYGYKEGRKPNPTFDPLWYMQVNPDVAASELQPLLHYALLGEKEGRRPSALFDPAWYRAKYKIPDNENCLAHYLVNRRGPFSPIPEFDAEFYHQRYPDVREAGIDPFEHYIHYGFREGRDPSAEFDTRFYTQRYLQGKPDVNPLLHYIENKGTAGVYSKPPEYEATIPSEIRRFTRPSAHFEEQRPIAPAAMRRAKVLAYYLTQFHAFPENDRWWGKGFSEWTNIARGVPRFKDHYQPRVPRDLGFYNLLNLDVMRQQVTMAKGAGVFGFVFYYYSFNGHRLMERPLEQLMAARDIDMPFCLMWANENWTRRWDGEESEVLISQNYRSEDDESLVADFARHFADPRYIRVDGRPLLMIYRPNIIPEPQESIRRWRELFKSNHGEDPIFVMGQSFNQKDPTEFGLDAAIEFPPHKVTSEIGAINCDVQILDDTFRGQVYAYDDVVRHSLDEPRPSYPLIKTVVPSWDNDARRQGTGLVIHGSTPAKYERWLSALVERAHRDRFFGDAFVCVNAWNEWCEGAYLEPDLHYGAAYLNATARAVTGLTTETTVPRVLLVGHDCFPSGAQHLLLNIGRTLKAGFGVEIEYLLLGGGAMEADYQAVAPVTIASDPARLGDIIQDLRDRGFRNAVANTVVTGDVVRQLNASGIYTVLLVHELPRILKQKHLEGTARAGIESANRVVFAADFVRDETTRALGIGVGEHFAVRPQGSYKRLDLDPEKALHVRQELGLKPDDKLVIGVGYADMRKGFDLFMQTWRTIMARDERVQFCWIGAMDPILADWLAGEMRDAQATKRFHLIGYRSDVDAFFAAADALVLSSREDPFPTVVLEALSAGLQVFAFDRSGGIPGFLEKERLGTVVPYGDVTQMAAAVQKALSITLPAAEKQRLQDTIARDFAFGDYVLDLLRMAIPGLPSVSVVVPNYNYEACLPERLGSIFDQSHPVQEVIVLDDCSSDDSVSVIVATAEARDRDVTLVLNEKNSGSVFAQWRKAAEMAKGEFVWIAEADDLAESTFLAELLALIQSDPAIQMAFSDSKAIDGKGEPVFDSYKPYYATIESGALTRTEVFEGTEFTARFIGIKNVILNVSAVLWRREALLKALDACVDDLKGLKMAGDWRLYLEVLSWKGAKIAYCADPLNTHRRHSASVTHSLNRVAHVNEIRSMQEVSRKRFALPSRTRQGQDKYFDEVSQQLLQQAS
jgi:glycosyltransferase involved in cell wall biosynthesis